MTLETRSIIVPIRDPEKQLWDTIDAFLGACNEVSFFAHAEQIFSAPELQKHLYHHLREGWGLRAQMTCSALRQVASLYKHKTFSEQCKKRDRGIFLHRRTMPLQKGRDWTLLSDGLISINTLHGRMKVQGKWGAYQRRFLEEGWHPTAARLVARRQALELHITLEREAPPLRAGNGIAGVDLGQNNLATFAFGKEVSLFWKGGLVKNIQRCYRQLYQSLQAKGTRGAKWLLKRHSGKQRRWQRHVNHEIANWIVKLALECGVAVIALEELSGIRKKGRRRTPRQRADFHGWSFFQLQQLIEYKAAAVGIKVQKVNPYQTSMECPECHHVQEGQRHRHRFCCRSCEFELHADLAAARTIALRASA